MVGTALWAAFATTGVYVFGSIVQAVLMLTGVAGDADKIDTASIAYVVLFLVAAVGFGILAFSYAGRAGLGRREMLLGTVGAPVILGGVLIALQMNHAAADGFHTGRLVDELQEFVRSPDWIA